MYIATPFDLEWTDLPARPLMVPLMQELVRQGVGAGGRSVRGVAGVPFSLPAHSTELVAQGAGGENAGAGNIPIEPTATTTVLRRSGVYRVMDDRGTIRAVVGINADTRGSRTEAQSAEPIAAKLSSLMFGAQEGGGAGLSARVAWMNEAGGPESGAGEAGGIDALARLNSADDAKRGARWSLYLLLGVLALAVSELLLARRASHAGIDVVQTGGGPGGSRPTGERGAANE